MSVPGPVAATPLGFFAMASAGMAGAAATVALRASETPLRREAPLRASAASARRRRDLSSERCQCSGALRSLCVTVIEANPSFSLAYGVS